jgi:hypothetical protein
MITCYFCGCPAGARFICSAEDCLAMVRSFGDKGEDGELEEAIRRWETIQVDVIFERLRDPSINATWLAALVVAAMAIACAVWVFTGFAH